MSGLLQSLLGDPALQGQAVAIAFEAIFGSKPIVRRHPNGEVELSFTPAQRDMLIEFLNRQVAYKPPRLGAPKTPKKPGLNISIMPVLLPVVVKNFWYVPAIPFLGGFMTGRHWRKNK